MKNLKILSLGGVVSTKLFFIEYSYVIDYDSISGFDVV